MNAYRQIKEHVIAVFRTPLTILSFLITFTLLFSSHGYSAPADASSVMTAQDLLASAAASFFRAGNYTKAIEEFRKLESQYPKDPRIFRYEGIAYNKAGDYAHAEENFLKALQIDPQNVAANFYLAENYIFQERIEDAKEIFELVVLLDEGGRYGQAAADRLKLLETSLDEVLSRVRQPTERRWAVDVDGGYEYDGNAAFLSHDKRFTDSGDANAGRYLSGFEAKYKFWKRGSWTAKTSYGYSQTFYDDNLDNLNTFVNFWTLSVSKTGSLFNRPLVFLLRDSFSHIVLERTFYAISNNLSATFVYRPHDRFQTIIFHSFAYTGFKNNSDTPGVSGRDGYTNTSAMIHTVYFNDAETCRFTFGSSYSHDAVEGRNFNRDVYGARVGFHFPIALKIEGDVDARYSYDKRIKYVPDPTDGVRRDHVWDLTFSLQRYIWKNVMMKVFFSYERVFGRNNAFEYIRPYGGVNFSAEI